MISPLESEIDSAAQKSLVSGLHIIGNLTSYQIKLLDDYHPFKKFIDRQILDLSLNKVGEVYHNFNNGGFTAVVCLSESHLSIHTWPERNYITFDVFLSNFLKDNSASTRQIFQSTINFFDAVVLEEKTITR